MLVALQVKPVNVLTTARITKAGNLNFFFLEPTFLFSKYFE